MNNAGAGVSGAGGVGGVVPPAMAEESPQKTERVNPFIAKANRDKMTKLAEAKAEKRVERAKREDEAVEQEYLEIDERIEAAKERYAETFKAAMAIDYSYETAEAFNKAWNRSDQAQSVLINLLARKRNLEAEVERMTAPAVVSESPVSDERATSQKSPVEPERAVTIEPPLVEERRSEIVAMPYGADAGVGVPLDFLGEETEDDQDFLAALAVEDDAA